MPQAPPVPSISGEFARQSSNYLFAKKHNGTFILRIEDTDRQRFQKGSYSHILESLEWCGLQIDEGPDQGGDYGPYIQSERLDGYRRCAQKLVENEFAYYAFDTQKDLEILRAEASGKTSVPFQYDSQTRGLLKNSLSMTPTEVEERLESGDPYVIRIKIPADVTIKMDDLVRGQIIMNSSGLDDKVLFKSDGFPTYHLAKVVDDNQMRISHVIRGEEWLSSMPYHVLLYEKLFPEAPVPQFAHLPLLLRAVGREKLSKRKAADSGELMCLVNWYDKENDVLLKGYREQGFLPEALINYLTLLSWKPDSDREIFRMEELPAHFSLGGVSKSGGEFDASKARWFNQEHLTRLPDQELEKKLRQELVKRGVQYPQEKILDIVKMLRGRISLTSELFTKSKFLYQNPQGFDQSLVESNVTTEVLSLFRDFVHYLEREVSGTPLSKFSEFMSARGQQANRYLKTFRLLVTGEGRGPDLATIFELMGVEQLRSRLTSSINILALQVEGKGALRPEVEMYFVYRNSKNLRLDWERMLGAFDSMSPHGDADAPEIYSGKILLRDAVANIVEGRWKEGLANLDSTIKLHPDDPVQYVCRAWLLLEKGMKEEASQGADQVCEQFPRCGEANLLRAHLEFVKGNYADSLEDFQRALSSNPMLAVAHYGRGEANFFLGKKKEALEDFNAVISLDSQFADAYYNRGMVYQTMGKKKEADSDWKMAKDLGSQKNRAGG